MGDRMEDYKRALIHKIEISRLNRDPAVSKRETNIYERVWRMHMMTGRHIYKRQIEQVYKRSTYFRYLCSGERLIYEIPNVIYDDHSFEQIPDIPKKRRGRPPKSMMKAYEYQPENYTTNRYINDDYLQQYHHKNVDPYINQDYEYVPVEGRNEFMRTRDSWTELFKSMTNGLNNESMNDYYEEDPDKYGYNSPNFHNFPSEPCCMHCSTKETSLWRRLEGKTVCNACGLYYKMHGVVRPKTLKKSVIKKRRRLSKRKKLHE